MIILAITPSILAYFSDINNVTEGMLSRSGAIMALFAAFLEFRTHEIQAIKERESIQAVWRTIGVLVEGLVKIDQATKYVLREMSHVIKSAGMKPAMGDPEDIKDIILSERIKSLKHIPVIPENYYTYNGVISSFGKILVISGTLIWAFGDILTK